eukprot:GGOE01014919.1.p1 GENE.GGOE01014919.1~~GGOE01014919.1.p1  ORF type:complete len:325 (-),score=92.52 GGOE01014919.1:266-1240(-)
MGGGVHPGGLDWYQVLGVLPSTTAEQIKQAFKRKALESHPDKNPDGEATFKLVAEAYSVLGSEVSRREYDAEREPHRRRTSRSTTQSNLDSNQEHTASGRRRRTATGMTFQEMFHFDHEMAAKKGGFMRDFGQWRAQAEFEKEQLQQQTASWVREREAEEEVRRARENTSKQRKLEEIAKDVLQDWQDEMRQWEERRAEEEARERAEAARKARDAAALAEEVMEKAPKARPLSKPGREAEVIPSLAELDIRSDEELTRLENLLQSRLNYIQELRRTRQYCVVCHEHLREGGPYHCGHGPVTCLGCSPLVSHCPKCHVALREEVS